ncbi:hypothetical protein TcCL_Unassigned02283 [Trypanosoma cruzi]|nr:hypothetical protein TcCL_Unassigned02283 [Trypanosoma cruzi]
MGGVEKLQALADVIAGVRAGVSATRSAAFGKAFFTLAVEAGTKGANVRAHRPTFCTVLPRRLDLIASHVGPSPCGRNVVSKRSRGRSARHLHSSVEVSRGGNAGLSASGISLPFDAIFGESVGTV